MRCLLFFAFLAQPFLFFLPFLLRLKTGLVFSIERVLPLLRRFSIFLRLSLSRVFGSLAPVIRRFLVYFLNRKLMTCNGVLHLKQCLFLLLLGFFSRLLFLFRVENKANHSVFGFLEYLAQPRIVTKH